VWTLGAAMLTILADGFAPGRMRARLGQRPTVSALDALRGKAYDEEFVTTLNDELGLQPETVEELHRRRVPELTLRALSRHELQTIFNLTLNDAVMISSWSTMKKEEEEKEEKARIKEEEKEEARIKEEEKEEKARIKGEKEKEEKARIKEEEKADRARLKKLKLESSKHVRIYNEADQKYADVSFSDQISLQTFLSGSRIPALALVDANRTSTLLITAWEQMVNNSCYAHPSKVREAVDVLTLELENAEKNKAEYGCGRRLANNFQKEFDYIGSDIKMKDHNGRDLGDIDTLYIAKDRSLVALLERKRSGSGNVSSVAALVDQVHATKRAFMDPNTSFSVPNVWETFDKSASVLSVVYCRTGPDSLFRKLLAEGIHVTTDSVEFLAPGQQDDL